MVQTETSQAKAVVMGRVTGAVDISSHPEHASAAFRPSSLPVTPVQVASSLDTVTNTLVCVEDGPYGPK